MGSKIIQPTGRGFVKQKQIDEEMQRMKEMEKVKYKLRSDSSLVSRTRMARKIYEGEWIEPVYIAVTNVTTEIGGVKHRKYEVTEE